MHFEIELINDEQETYSSRTFYTLEGLFRYIKEELDHDVVVFAYLGSNIVDSIHINKERLDEVRDEL